MELVVEALRMENGGLGLSRCAFGRVSDESESSQVRERALGCGCRVRIGGLTVPHFLRLSWLGLGRLAWPSQSPAAFPSLLRPGGAP